MIKDFEETEFGTILHNGSEYFSASYLASLNISKFPTSRAGVYKKAALEGWITIHVAGKGARDGVKRIQRKLNGSFVIMTDNDAYKPEEMNEEDAMSLPVIGKVVWFGRRI